MRISAYRAAHLEAPAAAPAGNLRAPAAPAALLAAFLAAFLAAPALLAGPNVLDLNQLNALGISQETVRDIVTESLSQRGRPPMDADLILSLSRYGGEPLMRAYLDLDRESRLAPEPPLSREAVMAMMARLEGRDEIIRRIDTIRSHTKEAGRPEKRARSKGPAGGGKAERPSAPSAGDVSVEEGDLPGDFNNKGAAPAAGASPSAGAAPGAGTAPGAAAAAETPAAVPSPGAGASAAAYPPAADPAGTPAVGADAPGALPRRAASPAALAAAGSVPGSGPYIQGIIHASGSPVATSPGSASDAAEAAFAYEEFQSGAAADAPEGSASRAAAGAMSENEGALALGGAGSQLALGTPKPEAGGPEGGKPAEPARGPEPSVTAGASEPAEDGWRAASETRTADAGTYQAWTSSEGATLHMGTFQALTPDGHRVRVHRNARMSGAAPSAE
ncbi:MAG: hypothetical protein LBG06_07950 [Deltaproteobacteria bacterium]|nr:hypothetical protein [Deltaproteobacteria bacterium]